MIIGYTTKIATLAIHSQMVKAVFKAPINLYFDVTPTGQILNRFHDVEYIEDAYNTLFCLVQ
jgi:ABC-type bacteriocin/lantibiotic exporter with double-glycine peptidase domain